MKYHFSILISVFISIFFIVPSTVHADAVDLSKLTAQGVAVYGWHNGIATELYNQNEMRLFPVASITKLVTAKAAEVLYPENTTFVVPPAMAQTLGNTNANLLEMSLSRDDLLRALLITSNNDAGKLFADSAGDKNFIEAMNDFLHTNGYTKTSFINPTGLDPAVKNLFPNSLTPKSLSYLFSNIYKNDPLLSSILEQKTAAIVDQRSGTALQLKSTDELNNDPFYSADIILSKTGTTTLAGQNLVFITNGQGSYDYITVVLLHSKDRYTDGKLILDWLQQIAQYRTGVTF